MRHFSVANGSKSRNNKVSSILTSRKGENSRRVSLSKIAIKGQDIRIDNIRGRSATRATNLPHLMSKS